MNALRKVASSLLILLIAIALATAAAADQTGEIRGTVGDASGGPLPGVLVTARSPGLQGQRTAVSDARGAFRLPLLPLGTYALTFDLQGVVPLSLAGNDVRLGQTVTLGPTGVGPTGVRS